MQGVVQGSGRKGSFSRWKDTQRMFMVPAHLHLSCIVCGMLHVCCMLALSMLIRLCKSVMLAAELLRVSRMRGRVILAE